MNQGIGSASLPNLRILIRKAETRNILRKSPLRTKIRKKRPAMNDFPVHTAEQLIPLFAAFRKRRGLSQAELAERIGVGQQTISQLERNPHKATIERLLRALAELDVELVLREKKSPPSATPSQQRNREEW
jgi:HTH-type transcriptional regulator/antitoxin HipB